MTSYEAFTADAAELKAITWEAVSVARVGLLPSWPFRGSELGMGKFARRLWGGAAPLAPAVPCVLGLPLLPPRRSP